MDTKEIKEYDYTINILIATNKHNGAILNEYFTSKSRFNVVGMTDDCERAKKMVLKKKPDVVIFDFLLANGDGISLLKYIYEHQKIEPKPKCILVSAFASEFFVNKALEIGAKFFMPWPCDLDGLRNNIVDLFIEQFAYLKEEDSEAILDNKILEMLKVFKMNVLWLGFKYFKDAVKIKMQNAEYSMKDIYNVLCDKYGQIKGVIERDMRHAINSAWDKGRFIAVNEMYGREIFELDKKPTNIAFITAVVELMKEGE